MCRLATTLLTAAMALVSGAVRAAGTPVDRPELQLDRCNPTWTSPSRDSSGSMPLGNGDIGLNLWVEADGDLLCYLSKTDAWSGAGRLLKLGRVRVSLDPNPFRAGLPFRQTLRLRQGEIEIVAGAEGEAVTLRIWVDALRPVVHVEAEGASDFTMQVGLEVWRSEPRELAGPEKQSAYGMTGGPEPLIVEADTILPRRENRVTWFHRNETSCYPITLRVQGLGDFLDRFPDPLLHRTFGGCISGEGLVAADDQTLRSTAPGQRRHAAIRLLTAQTTTSEAWVGQLDRLVQETATVELEQARREHRRWWAGFWNRSWIFADAPRRGRASQPVTRNERTSRIGADSDQPLGGADGPADASPVTLGYVLQRFINACGGRGTYPIKFNGSIFTVDAVEDGQHYDADYRRWGGCYWFQNTRLPYWAMLYAGDFDLMQPLFRMYREALPLARERTRKYYGHGGAFFPETMYFWGTYNNDNYGWNRQGKPDGLTDNTYIRYYWDGALELAAIMLDYYALTGDERFAGETLVPLARDTLHFYERHYPKRDAEGKIVFEPSQALETWQDATNPLSVIAGLRYVVGRLLEEIPTVVAGEARDQWQRLGALLPELPLDTTQAPPRLLPAQRFERLANSENPELYAVFPYRLYGLGKPNLDAGRAAFDARRVKRTGGWTQDPIQAALLGLTDTAAAYTQQNFATKHQGSRFPAFWGPNFDWIPDQDHGGVSMIALQRMLMQCDGDRILLLPAWPREWNVDFRLHAPHGTTVRAVWQDGKLAALEVTPAERRQHLVLPVDQ
jgi:alpha-L-fucosidase 2